MKSSSSGHPPESTDVAHAQQVDELPLIVGRFRLVRQRYEAVGYKLFEAFDEKRKMHVWLQLHDGLRLFDWLQLPTIAERVQRAGGLNPKGVVRLIGAGRHDHQTYLVTDHRDGCILDAELDRRLFSTDESIVVVRHLLNIVGRPHRHLVIHRSIHPRRILIDESNRITLMGLELPVGQMTTDDIYELVYLAPEQVDDDEAKNGPPTDIYATGVLLYELLTGKVPFEADSRGTLEQMILFRQPESIRTLVPELSLDLAAVVARCLAKEPSDRFPNAESLEVALADLTGRLRRQGVEPVSQLPSQVVHVPKLLRRGRPGWIRRTARHLVGLTLLLILAPVAYNLVSKKLDEYRSAGAHVSSEVEDTDEGGSPPGGQPTIASKSNQAISPLPAESSSPPAMLPGGIDLLSMIDVNGRAVRGNWTRIGSRLISPRMNHDKDYSLIRIPYDAPVEYTLQIKAKSETGEALVLGLANGSCGFGIHLKRKWRKSWIEPYDFDRPLSQGENPNVGGIKSEHFLKHGQSAVITCVVTRDSIRVDEGGQIKLEWKGDFAVFPRQKHWALRDVPNHKPMFLLAYGNYEIEELRLHPAAH